MDCLKSLLFKGCLFGKSDCDMDSGTVGISVNDEGIAMVHLIGSNLSDITVSSYRFAPVNNKIQQLEALQGYIEEYQLFDFPCNYVLPIDKYVMGIINAPEETTKENFREKIAPLVKDFIDYSVEDAIIDIIPLPLKSLENNKDASYAVLAKKDEINDVSSFITEAGLRLVSIDIQELCLRNLVALHGECAKGVLLLCLYPNGGKIILMNGKDIFMTRMFNLSLNDLFLETTDVASDQQRTNELLYGVGVELQSSIDYCSSMFHHPEINCLMLSPSEVSIDKVSTFLTAPIGMPVHKLHLQELMKFNKEISKLEQSHVSLAIGAALKKFIETGNKNATD